jgi:hypothetical protein
LAAFWGIALGIEKGLVAKNKKAVPLLSKGGSHPFSSGKEEHHAIEHFSSPMHDRVMPISAISWKLFCDTLATKAFPAGERRPDLLTPAPRLSEET